MIINKRDIIVFLSGCLVGFFISYSIFKKTEVEVDVPIKIDVPVPPIKKEFDTIKLPGETIKLPGETKIDYFYYKQYLALKDSVSKNEAYKDAITIREYNTPFEDDRFKINVYNKVRGTLLATQVKAETKPYTIPLDTTVKVKIPKQAEFFIGGETILPIDPLVTMSPSIAPGFVLVNKKHTKTFTGGYDFVNKVAKGGIYFRL